MFSASIDGSVSEWDLFDLTQKVCFRVSKFKLFCFYKSNVDFSECYIDKFCYWRIVKISYLRVGGVLYVEKELYVI